VAVEVGDAPLVVRVLRVGATALRHVQGKLVVVVQPRQQLAESLGHDGPAEVGDRVAVELHHVERQPRLRHRRGADAGGVVVVHAERVDRCRDELQIPVPYRQIEALRIAAPEQGIGEEAVVQPVIGVSGGHV
jgi:hypothetical protein